MALAELEPAAGALGATWEIETFAPLADDAGALRDLQRTLDERAVVVIHSAQPMEASDIAKLQRFLGEPESRRAGPSVVPGTDFLGDFSGKGKPDDGRPRVPAFIESLHYDTMANGPALYGVHYSRLGESIVPMKFVDMRAITRELSAATKAKLAGLKTRHTARQRPPPQPTPWTMQPLLIKHPRTGEPLLLLPNRRDNRIEGMDDAAGSALISELWRTVEAAPSWDIQLRPHTLVLWDNMLCVHDNPAFARDKDRTTWFFNVVNDRPLEALAV